MACVALTSLMATIQLEFLQPNHRVSVFDEKPLKSLFQKLSSLEAFLKKEYSNGGAPNRDLQIKIRDFALKAEDAIEIQLTNILQKAHEGELHLHRTLQEAAKEAEELLKIINNSSEVEADNIGSLQCSPQFEDKMFGRDGSFIAIKFHLSHQDRARNRKVVSIFGAPGVGKTTLCQKLYSDEKVVSCFDIKVWVTIPRRYNAQQLLCHLLQSMSPTLNEDIDMLKEQLHKHLKCKRYLIVLEDVPTTLVWDDIQSCFPDDSNASRILLTTLFGDVAKYVSKPSFHISFLNPSESWDLFFYRFSGNQYMYMAPKFKEIAKSLVEECKGLPRSIVTVADRLSKCDYTVKEWRKIEKELL
ncbi:putative late blight resistance protein homolog R1A-3 [Ipomoea triloba]|uniref:putative late blight resistance protein homolog R1A-3 n=1 Tax=Ipomoea triloba TaxID=35885 RepID=UPI00125CFE27|nr:putative late blight resistance protein homolog R1A-3 [Ipomoea triloba]